MKAMNVGYKIINFVNLFEKWVSERVTEGSCGNAYRHYLASTKAALKEFLFSLSLPSTYYYQRCLVRVILKDEYIILLISNIQVVHLKLASWWFCLCYRSDVLFCSRWRKIQKDDETFEENSFVVLNYFMKCTGIYLDLKYLSRRNKFFSPFL